MYNEPEELKIKAIILLIENIEKRLDQFNWVEDKELIWYLDTCNLLQANDWFPFKGSKKIIEKCIALRKMIELRDRKRIKQQAEAWPVTKWPEEIQHLRSV
jgi:hypothetical protein